MQLIQNYLQQLNIWYLLSSTLLFVVRISFMTLGLSVIKHWTPLKSSQKLVLFTSAVLRKNSILWSADFSDTLNTLSKESPTNSYKLMKCERLVEKYFIAKKLFMGYLRPLFSQIVIRHFYPLKCCQKNLVFSLCFSPWKRIILVRRLREFLNPNL